MDVSQVADVVSKHPVRFLVSRKFEHSAVSYRYCYFSWKYKENYGVALGQWSVIFLCAYQIVEGDSQNWVFLPLAKGT